MVEHYQGGNTLKNQIVRLEIGDQLDLHCFSPAEIGSLIPEYLMAAHQAGIRRVRLVHGKGKGILRRSVHAILDRMDMVETYHMAGHDCGHWGATIVYLK